MALRRIADRLLRWNSGRWPEVTSPPIRFQSEEQGK